MQNCKVNYEVYSKPGQYHELYGKENEDSINIVSNSNYIFVILADGCGSSDFGKISAQLTVDFVSQYSNKYSEELFLSNKKTVEDMIINLQQTLEEKAKQLGTTIKEMECTLVMLCVDLIKKIYLTIHIGDGLVAKKGNQEWEIVSYPENGTLRRYTYFVNEPSVFNHLRVNCGSYDKETYFLVASDGLFENCFNTTQYIERIDTKLAQHKDDTSYCILKVNMLQ